MLTRRKKSGSKILLKIEGFLELKKNYKDENLKKIKLFDEHLEFGKLKRKLETEKLCGKWEF